MANLNLIKFVLDLTTLYIQGICKAWKDDPNVLENLSDEVIEVIENLKIEFPRIQKWENIKIATRICETWENADTLRNERNEKILKYVKETDLDETDKIAAEVIKDLASDEKCK